MDLILSDKHMDLIAEGIDIAVRARQLEDSALVARHLFENPMFLFASPGYLAKSGTPEKPEELKQHNRIVYSQFKTVNIWHFTDKDKEISVPVSGNFQCDNGDAILEATVASIGIATLPFWMIHKQIESGQLEISMTEYKGSPIFSVEAKAMNANDGWAILTS